MKICKFISVTLLACAALFAVEAQAQRYNPAQIGGGTFNIAATSTNTTIASTNLGSIVATKALDVAIQPQFKLTGAGTSAVVLKFDESLDNSHWTVATRTITVTAAGTTTVSGVSNFTVGAVGYLRLSQIENPNSAAITNIVVKYVQKFP